MAGRWALHCNSWIQTDKRRTEENTFGRGVTEPFPWELRIWELKCRIGHDLSLQLEQNAVGVSRRQTCPVLERFLAREIPILFNAQLASLPQSPPTLVMDVALIDVEGCRSRPSQPSGVEVTLDKRSFPLVRHKVVSFLRG